MKVLKVVEHCVSITSIFFWKVNNVISCQLTGLFLLSPFSPWEQTGSHHTDGGKSYIVYVRLSVLVQFSVQTCVCASFLVALQCWRICVALQPSLKPPSAKLARLNVDIVTWVPKYCFCFSHCKLNSFFLHVSTLRTMPSQDIITHVHLHKILPYM